MLTLTCLGDGSELEARIHHIKLILLRTFILMDISILRVVVVVELLLIADKLDHEDVVLDLIDSLFLVSPLRVLVVIVDT